MGPSTAWHPGALPETYQGVDGFGPILGLHSTQGAVGQAVRGGGGEHEEASRQHQPLPLHSALVLPAGRGERADNEICGRLSCGLYPEPAVSSPVPAGRLQGKHSRSPSTDDNTEAQRGTVGAQGQGSRKVINMQ